MPLSLGRRGAAEALGTAFLLAAVVGSGIMAERLAGGNVALALLANAIATGGALFALILVFAPWSGAHFNPVVTLALAIDGEIAWRDVLAYIAAQFAGAISGVWLAHLMFGLPILEASVHARSGIGQWTGEVVATFGLLLVIESGRRAFAQNLPAAIAAYITAGYWFTSSTSFANPAVTVARALTDSFAGIAPRDVLGFVLCQCLGAAAAVGFVRWLEQRPSGRVSLTAQASPTSKIIDS
jgi:glycerol uptake facilitator-like aquaporin